MLIRSLLCFSFLLVLCAPVSGQASDRARIVGRVTDQQNEHDPVGGAAVSLRSIDGSAEIARTVTDERGWFSFDAVPTQTMLLVIEKLAYRIRTDTVQPVAGRTLDLGIHISADPVALDPIVVQVRSRWLEQNGFYERRLDGMKASVIDRAMIERRRPAFITDMIDELPSVEVIYGGPGQRTVRFTRYTGTPAEAGKPRRLAFDPRSGPDARGCEPDLYIDGTRYRSNSWSKVNKVDDYNVLAPGAIEAIEVYIGNTPPSFHHACGVILVWTRR